jgi:septal ring factor EnvC (AmiA/AmiB activator)
METRLDRIEKALETLLIGIAELKESQKKTDEQLSRTDAQILDLKESQRKTDEQMRRTDAKLARIGKQLADQGLVQVNYFAIPSIGSAIRSNAMKIPNVCMR